MLVARLHLKTRTAQSAIFSPNTRRSILTKRSPMLALWIICLAYLRPTRLSELLLPICRRVPGLGLMAAIACTLGCVLAILVMRCGFCPPRRCRAFTRHPAAPQSTILARWRDHWLGLIILGKRRNWLSMTVC